MWFSNTLKNLEILEYVGWIRFLPSRILGSRLILSGFRASILPRGDCDAPSNYEEEHHSIIWNENDLLSAFQVPKPFGLALKSPNLGAFCVGGGERIDSGTEEVGGGLNFGRMGEKLGPE